MVIPVNIMTKFDNVKGFFTWPRLYTNMVYKYQDDSVFVELGVFEGRSLYYLLKVIRDKRKNIKVFGVDYFKGISEGGYEQTLKNLSEFKGHFRIMNMDSAAASKKFEDNSVDFIFIDAGHEYDEVKADILSWLPKMKKGGVMAGHDYNGFDIGGGYPGVRKAVDELFGRKVLKDYIDEDCWMVNIK